MKKDYVEKVFLVADVFETRKRLETEYQEVCAKRGKWNEKDKYYVKSPVEEAESTTKHPESKWTYQKGSWDEMNECLVEQPDEDDEVESLIWVTPLQTLKPDQHMQGVPNVQPPTLGDMPVHPNSEEDKIDAMKGLSDMKQDDSEESDDGGKNDPNLGEQKIGESSNVNVPKAVETFILKKIDIDPTVVKSLIEERKIEAEKYKKFLLSRNVTSITNIDLYDYNQLRVMYKNEKEKMDKEQTDMHKRINMEELNRRHNGMCGYLLEKGLRPEVVDRMSRKEVITEFDYKKKLEEKRKDRKEINRKIDEEMERRRRQNQNVYFFFCNVLLDL